MLKVKQKDVHYLNLITLLIVLVAHSCCTVLPNELHVVVLLVRTNVTTSGENREPTGISTWNLTESRLNILGEKYY